MCLTNVAHTLSWEAADGWLGIEVVSDDVTSPIVETADVTAGVSAFLSSKLPRAANERN